MSLSLVGEPLIEYSFKPSLCTARSIVTSGKSISKTFLSLLKTTFTEARLALGSEVAPFQIKSSPRLPRRLFIDCSPSTNLKASATLLFPEPFGPTIEEIGVLNSKEFFLAKDLNPDNSIDFRYMQRVF